MAKKIREYDSNYFIVVVSNYAWESYFSDDLARTLENCGGFLIKEFANLGSARFGNFTRVHDFLNDQSLRFYRDSRSASWKGIRKTEIELGDLCGEANSAICRIKGETQIQHSYWYVLVRLHDQLVSSSKSKCRLSRFNP
jgi:hypothetical protein